jgi:thioredoxin-related protein
MKLLSVMLVSISLSLVNGWETDFDGAKKKAEKEHKFILLNFAGSDWCIPCIRLHKQVFEDVSFQHYADSSLVLIKADFPRLKKNKLSKDQQKKNDKLAEEYNPKGIFPFTLLLDANGKVIKTWEGLPNLSGEQFASQINDIVNARK